MVTLTDILSLTHIHNKNTHGRTTTTVIYTKCTHTHNYHIYIYIQHRHKHNLSHIQTSTHLGAQIYTHRHIHSRKDKHTHTHTRNYTNNSLFCVSLTISSPLLLFLSLPPPSLSPPLSFSHKVIKVWQCEKLKKETIRKREKVANNHVLHFLS